MSETVQILAALSIIVWGLCFVTLVVMLSYRSRAGQQYVPLWWATFFWIAHAFIFYTALLVFRVRTGYVGPSFQWTLWTYVLMIQAIGTIGLVFYRLSSRNGNRKNGL